MSTPSISRRSVLGAGLGLAAFGVVGCGNSSSGKATQVPTDPAKVSGDLSILVASAPGSDAGFKAINEAFLKKYPNVKINFSSVPNDNYAQTKNAQLTAGSVDILVAYPKEVPSYVPASNAGDDARLADNNGFVDLTSQPFMAKFNPTVIEQIKYKGKNYCVPTGLSYYSGVMYNKKIFADNKVSIPTTWTEFKKLCDTLKGNNVVPLGIGGKDSAGTALLALVQSVYAGKDAKVNLAKGLYGYTTKLNEGKQLEVMQKLSTLYDYAQPNFAGFTKPALTADFVNGKHAMQNDGTWNVTTLQKSGAGKLDFGYFPLPASDNPADNKSLGGKVELSLAVPANSKNTSVALAWLDFFANNYKTFNDNAGFVPSQSDTAGNAFYSEIAPYIATFEPAWDTIWIANSKAGPAAKVPFNWSGLKPMGALDVQGAADASEKDWEAGK